MNFFKTAASAVSAASKMAADSAKRTYADLKAPPTTVRCQGCPQEVDVPATAFDWTCTAGHVSKRADELCVECKIAQPKDLPEPTVTCPSCQHVTVVPSSNAKKHARESAQKTKEFAAQTAAATKAGIEHLRATPTTFRQTNNANTLADLGNCWRVNEEAASICKQCGQKKSEQKAICGVCRQSTVIPGSNFTDGLKHTVTGLKKGSKKAYLDAAGKPYITCNKCNTNVPVAASSVSKHAQPSTPAHAAAEVKGSVPPAAEGAEMAGLHAAPGGASPAAAPVAHVQAEGTYNGEAMVCPSCRNPIGE